MDARIDWIVETLHDQVRHVERNRGQQASAVRVNVPHDLAQAIGLRLGALLPHLELEIIARPGPSRVCSVEFSLEAS